MSSIQSNIHGFLFTKKGEAYITFRSYDKTLNLPLFNKVSEKQIGIALPELIVGTWFTFPTYRKKELSFNMNMGLSYHTGDIIICLASLSNTKMRRLHIGVVIGTHLILPLVWLPVSSPTFTADLKYIPLDRRRLISFSGEADLSCGDIITSIRVNDKGELYVTQ